MRFFTTLLTAALLLALGSSVFAQAKKPDPEEEYYKLLRFPMSECLPFLAWADSDLGALYPASPKSSARKGPTFLRVTNVT